MEFDNLSHAKIRLMYHIVLATKYRRPCLTGMEHVIEDGFRRASEGYKFEIVDIVIDMGDHAHLLIRVRNPRLSIDRLDCGEAKTVLHS